MLEQARRVKYCHGEINGPFDNVGISMGAFMGACRKEQLVLGCIPKAPQISDLIQLPLMGSQQKMQCSAENGSLSSLVLSTLCFWYF